MNVLICIPCLLTGGTEIQTLNLVKALVDGSHNVTTVCYFEHTEQMISTYKEAGSEVICLSKEGIRTGGWKGILFLLKGLRKTVRQFRPDVVHVQYMAPGAIPILILKLLGIRNVIATAHTAADIYPSLRLVHFIQKYCVRAFTCITKKAEESFFGSSQLYNEQTVLGIRNHFTIYNALPSYIAIADKPKVHNEDYLTIGVVSRLEKIKGMDLVVPAFCKVRRYNDNVRLLVVGDGSCRALMEQQTKDLKLEDSVKFVGRQTQDRLQDYYDEIDILLMPSRSEGFGLTAIEGMARGCVLVASDVGGLPEVVEDGKVGKLHKVSDVDDIADKVCSLVNDRKCLETMSETARNYVGAFCFDKYAELFNSLYDKLD